MPLANWGNTMIGQDDYVNQAANRARGQFDAGREAMIRQAGRMGINPNSGAFMNMLNNAQYERTAGMNAAANDASDKYLSFAQDQFNRDRSFGLDQQRLNDSNAQWWANFGAQRDKEKAEYASQEKFYKELTRRQQANPNQQGGMAASRPRAFGSNVNWLRSMPVNKWQYQFDRKAGI